MSRMWNGMGFLMILRWTGKIDRLWARNKVKAKYTLTGAPTVEPGALTHASKSNAENAERFLL